MGHCPRGNGTNPFACPIGKTVYGSPIQPIPQRYDLTGPKVSFELTCLGSQFHNQKEQDFHDMIFALLYGLGSSPVRGLATDKISGLNLVSP